MILKKRKTIYACALSISVLITLLVCLLNQEIILSYDEIANHLSVNIIENNIYIICDFHVEKVDYLANNNGTTFVETCQDCGGRCYHQSLQITATKWNILFSKRESVIYKRGLTSHGALSGESAIINNDGTISSINRYDTAIHYRNADKTEWLLWSLGN